MCHKIEKRIDQIAEKAKSELYKQKTYDKAPLRNKYFFRESFVDIWKSKGAERPWSRNITLKRC